MQQNFWWIIVFTYYPEMHDVIARFIFPGILMNVIYYTEKFKQSSSLAFYKFSG